MLGDAVRPAALADDGDRNLGPVLVTTRNLRKYFPIKAGLFSSQVGQVRAVDGVSFSIREGETVGLVGESGCGKTTVGRLLLRLIEPTSGHTFYRAPPEVLERIDGAYREIGPRSSGENNGEGNLSASAQAALVELDEIADQYLLYRKSHREMKELRARLQIVFQDPFSSLGPRMMIREVIAEPLEIQKVGTRQERTNRVNELLQEVGLNPEHAWRFPHEFSGGNASGSASPAPSPPARSSSCSTSPTSALDVSVQAQVLHILQMLQREQQLAYLFISHHLSVIRAVSDRVVVMYLGRVVEQADTDELFDRPLHPYTQALLSAIPIPDPRVRRERIILSGDVPSPASPPSGCHFHTRCPAVMPICSDVDPPLLQFRPGHWVACHLYPASSASVPADALESSSGAGPSGALPAASGPLPSDPSLSTSAPHSP